MYLLERYILFVAVCLIQRHCTKADDVCLKEKTCQNIGRRYLLYDVNPPEGFNLRLDVYMRMAILAYKMEKSSLADLNNFKLVLPPWSRLIHWKYSKTPEQIPWGRYFDLNSLKLFAPVVEMYEFFDDYPNKYKVVIDEVYTLQHFEDMFKTGNFEDRMKVDKCVKKEDSTFFFYNNMTAKVNYCLSYHGPATKLTALFLNTTANYILINHAEVALHEHFGNRLYWQVRRSIRFNQELINIASEFRKIHLNSTDKRDNTILPKNWKDEKSNRKAIGGPYLAVHLRRRDFLRSRPNAAPSLSSVAKQVLKALQKMELDTVFVATDASPEEFGKLSDLLHGYKVKRYIPDTKVLSKFKDGGVAIIDQIICSHARYFIGTHESTFTFRIEERREILGFSVDTTFNVFCNEEGNCPKSSVWKIVY